MKFLLTMLLLAGCATRGKDFPSDLSWIKKDQTKKEDVQLILGPPYEVGYSTGQPTWTYGYYKYQLLGDIFTKELKFYWTRDGVVERYSFSSSFPEDVRQEKANPKAP